MNKLQHTIIQWLALSGITFILVSSGVKTVVLLAVLVLTIINAASNYSEGINVARTIVDKFVRDLETEVNKKRIIRADLETQSDEQPKEASR